MLQKYGIYSSMCYTGGENSLPKDEIIQNIIAQLIKDFTEVIPDGTENGYKDVISFSGNRNGMDDETGLKNCEDGLKQIIALQKKMASPFRWNCSTVR